MYHLKPDCGGAHEAEWVMLKEDPQFDILTWLKAPKRVSAKGTYEFVNVLFAKEGGNER